MMMFIYRNLYASYMPSPGPPVPVLNPFFVVVGQPVRHTGMIKC